MRNPETKFYLEELVKTAGANRRASVKVGDEVPKWEGAEEKTQVKAVYKDLLNNEVWLTEFTLNEHIPKTLFEKGIPLSIIQNIDLSSFLKKPQKILYDTKRRAILYVRKIFKIFTLMPFEGEIKPRYKLLFESK